MSNRNCSTKELEQIAKFYGTEKAVFRTGLVFVYGSDNPTDRSKDHWRVIDRIDIVRAEIARDSEYTESMASPAGIELPEVRQEEKSCSLRSLESVHNELRRNA